MMYTETDILRIAEAITAGSGDCYDANGRLFMDKTILDGKKGMKLVHGEVTGQGPLEGVQYGHCWIEKGGTVIDVSNGNNIKMSKDEYYKLGRVGGNVHKYNPEQFRKKVLQYGHWGPWDLKTSTGL